MLRNLARRASFLPVVRRYTYIAFGLVWAALFRFPSFCLFVDPPLAPASSARKRPGPILFDWGVRKNTRK